MYIIYKIVERIFLGLFGKMKEAFEKLFATHRILFIQILFLHEDEGHEKSSKKVGKHVPCGGAFRHDFVSAKEPDGSSVKYDYAELCEEYMEYIATNFPDRGDIQEGVDPGEDNRHEECRAYLISELKKAVPRSFPGAFPCLFASAVRPDGAGCRGRRGIVVFVL